MQIETMKIVNATGDDFIVINKTDFDEKTMTIWNDKLKPGTFHFEIGLSEAKKTAKSKPAPKK